MVLVLGGLLFFVGGQEVFSATGDVQPYIESLEQTKEGMTLWETIKTGGFIMIVLGVLSFVSLSFIVYNFMTLKMSKILPQKFTEEIIQKLEDNEERSVKGQCYSSKHNLISRIVIAGIEKKGRGKVFAREAMENCAQKEVARLWQNISYLADIAAVAPLIGLLGTVLGMIQAFNVIAFQSAVVKPILLAGGVSKAMVTTAAGLIVAIPVMLFYTYFRGRVQEISDAVETYSGDIVKLVEELGEK